MSIATRTTYLAKCDYPDCRMAYDFWASSTEAAANMELADYGKLGAFDEANGDSYTLVGA